MNERIERIRAWYGLCLVMLGLSACAAIIGLVVTKTPMYGFVFGLCGVAFVLVAKLGKKYARHIATARMDNDRRGTLWKCK